MQNCRCSVLIMTLIYIEINTEELKLKAVFVTYYEVIFIYLYMSPQKDYTLGSLMDSKEPLNLHSKLYVYTLGILKFLNT